MTFSLCCWRFAFGARVIETLLKLSINVTRQLFLFFQLSVLGYESGMTPWTFFLVRPSLRSQRILCFVYSTLSNDSRMQYERMVYIVFSSLCLYRSWRRLLQVVIQWFLCFYYALLNHNLFCFSFSRAGWGMGRKLRANSFSCFNFSQVLNHQSFFSRVKVNSEPSPKTTSANLIKWCSFMPYDSFWS